MSNVKLDPARLVLDGDELYSIARTVDSAVSTLVSQLSGSAGMAGDDNAAEEFCQGSDGYDALAGPTIDAVSSFGNGLRIVDAALSNSGRAYDGAQKPGAGLDPATASPAEATPTIDESKSSVPSALGPGWPGALGEFQELLEWGLAQIGVVIPTGDEDKLQSAADAWGSFGDSIQSARSRVSSSMTNVAAMTLPQQGSMLSCRSSLATGLGKMRESADGMQQWISDFRTQLRQMREELGWFLKQMAIEIAAELAIGGLLTVVTAGLGAIATAAKVGTTVIRWCVKIAKLIDRLKDFLRGIRGIKGALIRGGLRAGKEGLQAGLASAIATTSVNHMRADEKGYTPQDVGTAFVTAFAGGAAASPVSRVLGGSGGPGLRAGTRQIAGETGAGAVDGLVSSAVESGITGKDFNPISGMVLGALLGGGLTAGGRGINALRPGGNNANSPAVNTPVDTPTPGSGSGSNSNGNGSGTTVDTDSSGIPTPGVGDSSSTAGDGTSVDVNVDAPSTSDGGGTPDAGGSSPDVSAPDVSAPEGSTPDVSTPDVSTPDVSTPSTPDSGTPTAPEAGTPTAPEASAPTTPEAGTPTAPEASAPTAPEAGTPTAPEASAPTAPEAGTPTAPEASAPTAPEAGGTPTVPEASAPTAPEAGTPTAPEAGTPTAPEAGAPTAPEAGAPTAPGAGTPTAPEAGASTAPEVGSPTQPDAPVAAAPAGGTSTSSSHADAPATDAPATDGSNTDAEVDAPEASDGSDADETAPAASDGTDVDDPNAPVDVAAAGGAAVAAGAAAMLGKPGFLPTHTPGGSTPAAPSSPASPNTKGPDGSAPGSTAPDGTAPGGTAPDGTAPDGSNQDGSNQDGSTDGDKPDTKANNQTERTIDEIDAALAAINPNYDPSDPANGYATNCGNTSAILNDFLNGSPTSEAPTGTLDTPQMEARTGNPQTPMTPAQIDASLRAMGAGSHCVVGLDRSTGDGHWFNAYFDGTTVWSIDAQTGTRSAWPPNEPNATTWDASIQPEHVAPLKPATPDAATPTTPNASTQTTTTPSTPSTPTTPTTPTTPSSSTASAPTTPSTPDASAQTSPGDANGSTGDKSSAMTPEAAADRSAASLPPNVGNPTVAPDHASDGSDGPGRTFNAYDIPELTPEIRQQLDALAAQDGSPIVRNEDGSYSLAQTIDVDAFNRSNPKHNLAEFTRQVELQNAGLNNLTIAEWQHNVDFYDAHNRVAKSEQAAANRALKAAGVNMTGQAVLHGPDQIAGGRADRFDGAGSFGINSSLGNQWRHRIADLRFDIADAASTIDADLRPFVRLDVELSTVDTVPAGATPTLLDSNGNDVGAVIARSNIPMADLEAYLRSVDPDAYTEYANTGVWPAEVQIPKDPSVLAGNSIDWGQVPQGGYVLDAAGQPIKAPHVPQLGDVLDRYGPPGGRYTSPVPGTGPYDYSQRSLPYVEDPSQYHQYEVIGDFSNLRDAYDACSDVNVTNAIDGLIRRGYFDWGRLAAIGDIAPGFNDPGMGRQIELPLSVDLLIGLGVLREI